jgi:hypothetical protein
VASLLSQHNQSHLVAKPENHGRETGFGKFGRQSISLKFCRCLLHAANLRHGTDGFTSLRRKCVLRIFIAHKNPPSSAGPEPARVGPTFTKSKQHLPDLIEHCESPTIIR